MNFRIPAPSTNLLVARKIYHVLMGVICLILYSLYLDREQALYVLAFVGFPCVVLDKLRLRNPKLNEFLIGVFEPILKPSERSALTGHTYFVLGLIFLVYFFEKPIVLLSVLYLSFGDPAASYIGSRWGRVKVWGGKTAEGVAANWVVSFLATAAFIWAYGNDSGSSVLLLCAVGATVSAFSELLPLPIDDNFSIPVCSGLLLWAIQNYA